MRDYRLKGLASLALACIFVSACGGEPNVYEVPLAAAKSTLGSATQRYDMSDGSSFRVVRAAGWQGDTLDVEMQSSFSEKPNATCQVLLESIDEATTRITPDCSRHIGGGKAVFREMLEIEAQEFVVATMTGRQMDRRKMAAQGGAVAMKNMPEMQGEALAANAEDLKRRYQDQQDGWASTDQQQADDGWGAQ